MSQPMQGKIVVITGANAGIGKATAQALVAQGAHVVMACRSLERAEQTRADIARAVGGTERIEPMQLDVADMRSIASFAAEVSRRHPKIDVLINNAGAWWLERKTSPQGHELQWATNVLGPHLLTRLLLAPLRAAGGRIVNVASTAAGGLDLADVNFENRKYDGVKAYSATKQADRMLSWAWAEQLAGTGVTVNAMSPGLVASEFNRSATGFFKLLFKLMRPFSRTTEKGADTSVWLASAPELAGKTGGFYEDRKEKPCKFRDAAEVAKLWALLEQQSSGFAATSQPARAAR
jgi:NAD(P)-dependent dehydrogenase (short-subunit alcohol dehydrogenase family)